MPSRALAPALIDYYTDVFCVWAWIAQPRLDELQRQWGNKIVVRHRFLDIFGDRGAHARIAVGATTMPIGVAVEVEAIMEIER